MSWGYGQFAAEAQNLDKPVASSFGDAEVYREVLAGVDGRVLESAVGTGRILIPLFQAGVVVDGYDNSPHMLSVCRERCTERNLAPVLFDADMLSYSAAETDSAVILPTGSITLLCGHDEIMRALKCFRESLKAGGRLIIDLPPSQLLSEAEPMRRWSASPSVWTLQVMHLE